MEYVLVSHSIEARRKRKPITMCIDMLLDPRDTVSLHLLDWVFPVKPLIWGILMWFTVLTAPRIQYRSYIAGSRLCWRYSGTAGWFMLSTSEPPILIFERASAHARTFVVGIQPSGKTAPIPIISPLFPSNSMKRLLQKSTIWIIPSSLTMTLLRVRWPRSKYPLCVNLRPSTTPSGHNASDSIRVNCDLDSHEV